MKAKQRNAKLRLVVVLVAKNKHESKYRSRIQAMGDTRSRLHEQTRDGTGSGVDSAGL